MERERASDRIGRALQERLAKLTGSRVFWVAFIGILFALPLGRSLARTLPPAPPLLGDIQPFELSDQYGNHMGSEQLRSQVWVAAILPPEGDPANAKAVDTVRHIIHRTKNLGSMFHMVTLPSDAARTSVEDRKALVEKHCSSSQLWSYLGGTESEVAQAESRILASLGAGPGPHMLDGQLFLIDARGRIRGIYGSDAPSLDRLMQDTGYVANLP
jgi:cytochrome oxidase Cu insertion factor (SCO1/SenC/PrrC family)